MKNITWNKVKTTVKDWQVGDYIRQTSIVVIGVLITFVGSELVTQNSEKKDIQATMSLIRDELKSSAFLWGISAVFIIVRMHWIYLKTPC